MAEFEKVVARTAGEICARYTPEPETLALLAGADSPRSFLESLVSADQPAEARRFLAHALPRREAIFWAAEAVASVQAGRIPAPQLAALEAVRQWLAEPGDQHRRACWTASETSGLDTAAGLVALAVYFSEGSLSPEGLPPVAPAPHLAADTAANAMTLATLAPQPEQAPEREKAILAIGLEIAAGSRPLPVAKPPAK